jgi:hypothetical protein
MSRLNTIAIVPVALGFTLIAQTVLALYFVG